MDPLSVIAGIIGVLQAAGTIVDYLNHIKNASKDQQRAALELCNLQGLLQRLRFRVQEARSDDPWFDQIKQLATKQGPLDQFRDTIEATANKIVPASKIAKIKTTLLWKSEKTDLIELLTQIERLKSFIDLALSDDHFTLSRAIHSDIQDVKLQVDKLEGSHQLELRSKIALWLRLPDPSINYNTALQKRQDASGTWLLTSKEYQNWKASVPSSIWLNGKPGCGKTILSSTVIEDVQRISKSQPGTCTAYFYFDFNDTEKQTLTACLRSLLFQLSLQVSMTELVQLYEDRNLPDFPPRDDDVEAILHNLLDTAQDVYVILDALDESSQRDDSLRMIQSLIQDNHSNLHLLVTSRPEREIGDGLSPLVTHTFDLGSSLVEGDIRAYIENRLENDNKLCKWPEPVRFEIRDTLLARADGMFRWVFCQMETIRTCYKLLKLREALKSLPRTLDETYGRILSQIETDGNLDDAIRTLQLLCFSLRPLRQEEIVEVLAIDLTNEERFDPDNRLRDPDDIMIICSSLISLQSANLDDFHTQQNDKVELRPAHFSVQEYLLSDRSAFNSSFQPEYAHHVLAQVCLIYLLHLCDNNMSDDDLSDFPFAEYAAEYWWQHAQKSGNMGDANLFALAKRFFVDDLRYHTMRWFALCNSEVHWGRFVSDDGTPILPESLYIASGIGYCEMVDFLIDNGADVNLRGGLLGTALSVASNNGYSRVVQRLLERGADVNFSGDDGDTVLKPPLRLACTESHAQVIMTLLGHGADVHNRDDFEATPLHVVVDDRHMSIVYVLLDHGADVNLKDRSHNTPLHIASRGGQLQIVQILLDHGAEVDANDCFKGTPFYVAAINGHLEVMMLLVQRGADPHTQDTFGGTPLYMSSSHGDAKLVRYLLDLGADVHVRTIENETALWIASRHGHERVVKMLIDAGAAVDVRNCIGCSALQAARKEGHDHVVKLLMHHGAEDEQLPRYQNDKGRPTSSSSDEKQSSDFTSERTIDPQVSEEQDEAPDEPQDQPQTEQPTTDNPPVDKTTLESPPNNPTNTPAQNDINTTHTPTPPPQPTHDEPQDNKGTRHTE